MTMRGREFWGAVAAAICAGWAQAVDLPKDYVPLEYIRATGVQYIDTGYIHTAATKVEADLEVARLGQVRNWVAVFGARETNYYHHCHCFFAASGLKANLPPAYCRTGQESGGDPFIFDERVKLCCDGATATWQAAANPARKGRAVTTGTLDGGVNSMFIFDLNSSPAGGKAPDPSPAKMKLYGFRISERDVLARDFRPCRNPQGEAGLWDRVEGRFYGNCGKGSFLGSDGRYAPATHSLMTPWGEKVTPENAWREYPRPQMVRSNWTNLNGLWDFAVTSVYGTAGRPKTWPHRILVPFAPESPLSGVGRLTQPDELLWYTRTITCAKKPGERILLHFGGVDFRTMVFIGHAEVTDVPNEGGVNPWTVDITDYVKDGENELTLCVWDPTDDFVNANGKQRSQSHGCVYTRLSGIWQTVWMENVPARYIRGYQVATDIDASTVTFTFDVGGVEGAVEVEVEGVGKATAAGNVVTMKVPNARLWSPKAPNLYDFTARFGADEVKGYFGMRQIAKAKDRNGVLRFFLNHEPTFLLGTLDQGWWPDGLLTPPSDEAMVFDIQTLKNCGFNMMRKHMKVEPLRYYYWCDKLGLAVVQDLAPGMGRAQSNAGRMLGMKRYALSRKDMKEMVDTLQPVPSIVMWCPYNEGGDQVNEFLTHSMLDWVKRYDPTRLVNGPSGWFDFEGGAFAHKRPPATKHKPAGECEAADTIDMHDYRGPNMPAVNDRRICFLGEFGGLGHAVKGHLWSPKDGGWGYGGTGDTGTREGLAKVYLGLHAKLEDLARKGLSGSVYTQTTDIEFEINGILTYDRRVLKIDQQQLKAAHERVLRVVEALK